MNDNETIDAYLSGEMADAECAALEQRLASEPELRGVMKEQMGLHCALEILLGDDAGNRRVVDSVKTVLAIKPEQALSDGVIRELREGMSPRSRPWRVVLPLAAAALVLVAAGVWWGIRNAEHGLLHRGGYAGQGTWNAERGVVARIIETSGKDRVAAAGLAGRITGVKLGDGIRVGDRIEAGVGNGVKLGLGDKSWVKLSPDSRLAILKSTSPGCSFRLESGQLFAQAAPRPARVPLVVLTPQAKVEVKGTRFALTVSPMRNAERHSTFRPAAAGSPLRSEVPSSESGSTRLEVFGGLVGMTRLSDGKSVDVAAGRYAVAADGVELVALPLADQALMAAESHFARTMRAGSKNPQYGKVLFEDEFDGTLANWEVLLGKRGGESSVRSGAFAPHVRIEEDYVCANVADGILCSCVVLDTQRGADCFVGLRSKEPIKAERFVVEARLGLGARRRPDEHKGLTQISLDGIEIAETRVVPDGTGKSRGTSDSGLVYWEMIVHRWEFTPAPEQGENTLLCCCYAGHPSRLDRQGQLRGGDITFKSSSYVSPKSKCLLFSICGPDWDLIIDRVTVRELPEESVAGSAGTKLSGGATGIER